MIADGFEPFRRVCLIGVGLIGSSIARAVNRNALAGEIVAADKSPETLAKAMELGLCHETTLDAAKAVKGADLVILCTPVGTYREIASAVGPHIEAGTIVSDVGSVKEAVLRDVNPHLGNGVHFIPAHPIAGTEHSGPEAGFPELFQGRWCILTPPPGADEAAVRRIAAFWRRAGSDIEIMTADHHDRVLAITSHLPHLIAFTIVGTATDLEDHLRREVVRFSASGFRDFTRIAASDPVMWRDVFLNNRDAVLEVLGRFTEDLTALQRAIRWGDGDILERRFEKTRAVRRKVIEAKQA